MPKSNARKPPAGEPVEPPGREQLLNARRFRRAFFAFSAQSDL